MQPPLTLPVATASPARRSVFLWAPLLAAALLLSSCGGGSTPAPPPAPPTAGTGTGPVTAPLSVTVEQPLTLLGTDSARGLLRAATSGTLTVTVNSVPSGLTVTTSTQADSTSTLLEVQAQGRATSGGAVSLTIQAGGRSTTLSMPVLAFSVRPISSGAAGGKYEAGGLLPLADGSVLLRSSTSAGEEGRHHLVRFDPAQNTFSLLGFGVGGLETITSHTAAPDGKLWVTVRSALSSGSVLVSRDTAGSVKRYAVGATADTLNSATATAGRIWFTQYTRDRIAALNPDSGDVQSYPVDENAENLVLGTDSLLYYARFYADPAIIQLDPVTGTSKIFKVGTANVSLPSALTPGPGGSVWFIESRTGSVWRLNPQTGQQTALTLPTGARPTQLAVTPDGSVWVADPSRGVLYRQAAGSSTVETVPALQNAGRPDGPRALTAGPDGKLWYEAAGQLVSLN